MPIPVETLALTDVQAQQDHRNLPIQKVGIKRLKRPLCIAFGQDNQHVTATCALSVSLPANQKGTHMSRMIEHLDGFTTPLSADTLPQFMQQLQEKTHSKTAFAEFEFDLFLEKPAPITHTASMMNYAILWQAQRHNEQFKLTQTITIPVMSLCPASKKWAEQGAHSQRSHIIITIEAKHTVDMAKLISLVESQASAPLYAVLKKADEKHITEHSYSHPKFVEDIVRDVALALKNQPDIDHFSVDVENFESIHNHSAFAVIESREI